ncbi:MAG TPA: hypothetical protein DHV86_00945, partial [Methylophilaceae bacterium]|nr:hypothetical protein [Methylophilaceae bacterium]
MVPFNSFEIFLMTENKSPKKQGLYNPKNEHDSCGVGFVANIQGQKSHTIVKQGLEILTNLTHRGATGYDPNLGDGAGILIQMPDELFRADTKARGIKLPELGRYGVGMVFLPQAEKARQQCEKILSN